MEFMASVSRSCFAPFAADPIPMDDDRETQRERSDVHDQR